MSLQITFRLFVAGGAVLAMWLLVRFPKLVPERLTAAVGAYVAAWAALLALPHLLHATTSFAEGRLLVGVALFLIVLPTFCYWALSTMWVLRHMMGMLGPRMR